LHIIREIYGDYDWGFVGMHTVPVVGVKGQLHSIINDSLTAFD